MKHTLSLCLTLVVTLLFTTSTLAADRLTNEKVRAFISTLQEAETLDDDFDQLNEQMPGSGNPSEMPDFSSIFSDSVNQMRGHEAYNRMEGIVKENGFDSMEEWGATGDRVFQAWMAIEMEDQHPQMARKMAAAMDEINNNPNLSEAQKEQMRAMMGGATAAMESARQAPESDKQAVRPHMQALRAVTESGER
ncbi:hypothetical protein MARLIPOL_11511 [Marinobacter lipolyticus SM19]|uniref:Secreted protein n=1 Tax=Marinobacter lipolyticus SM19 TaxID=1318628 RepID=R8B110_9GAMM|nr:hypothetical protein [Marinobacter lipolyticus]EON92247.1 hypothetical protein MARLIPOL_11511 [Marinobacter lipolyticus SM19]